jgi:hypothetical protein
VRSILFKEKTLIVAPSEKKAKIIMGYIIDHIGDNILFRGQLEVENKDTYDRLKRERSKNRLTFRGGGEIMTLTLDSRNSKKSLEAAMGFGVGENGNVILDESSLIDDNLYASVKRMAGGKNAMLFEIGNPFYRNHFHKTFTQDKRYYKLFADYKTGIEEGRFSQEFIDEMSQQAFFDVYYECKFPDEEIVDERGYRQLITSNDINICKVGSVEPVGKLLKIGIDVGGGGDYNTFIGRWQNIAKVLGKTKTTDTMENVKTIQELLKQYPELSAENINIDDIGIGRGVRDRCHELGIGITGVSVGSTEGVDTEKYMNIKAQCSWECRMWLKQRKYLEEHIINYQSVWDQVLWIKYKSNSGKQVKIEPKEELKKRTGKSPDFYEGLMLTFYEPPYIGF